MKWAERIKAAKKRGEFTSDDVVASASWPTCAVGEKIRCDIFGPENHRLYRLGKEFMNAVEEQRVNQAAYLLNEIERFQVSAED